MQARGRHAYYTLRVDRQERRKIKKQRKMACSGANVEARAEKARCTSMMGKQEGGRWKKKGFYGKLSDCNCDTYGSKRSQSRSIERIASRACNLRRSVWYTVLITAITRANDNV